MEELNVLKMEINHLLSVIESNVGVVKNKELIQKELDSISNCHFLLDNNNEDYNFYNNIIKSHIIMLAYGTPTYYLENDLPTLLELLDALK